MTIGEKSDLPCSWMYLEAKNDGSSPRLFAYATDMTGRTLVKVPATVTTPGSVLTRPSVLASLISTVPKDDDVDIWTTGTETTELRYKCSAGKGTLALRNGGEETSKSLEALPFKGVPIFEIAASTLIRLIARTEFCTTTGRQPILSAVNFRAVKGGFIGEASDGIIAVFSYAKDDNSPVKDDATKECAVTVPGSGLIPLTKLLVSHKGEIVKVIPGRERGEESNNMYFRFSDTIYGTSLLTDKFPSIDKLFEVAKAIKGPVFKAPLAEVKKAMSRAGLFAESGHVTFDINDSNVRVYAQGNTRGEFETKIKGADDTQEVKAKVVLDIRYLVQAIKGSQSVNLSLGTSKDNSKVWP